MFPAKRHIAVIIAELDLLPAAHDAILINTRIAGRLFATPADSLDLPDGVRNGNQPRTPREKVVLKICAESVTHNWHIHEIHDV